MAEVVRDYLDRMHIGQVADIAVYKDNKIQYSAVGRILFFAVRDDNYAVHFEGGENAVIRWTADCEFTVTYDPEVRR